MLLIITARVNSKREGHKQLWHMAGLYQSKIMPL